MGQVRLKLTRGGPRELRMSSEVVGDMLSRAQRINRAAGGTMNVDAGAFPGGRGRARATVAAVSDQARRAEASNRTLTRAIDAGR